MADPDRPRVAQWLDDEDIVDALPNALPMGSLRTVQSAGDDDGDDDESDESESESEPEIEPSASKPPKRSNKHAPREMSSKRPVTRRRVVVNSTTPQTRDPRFLPLAGQFSKEKHQVHYSFLADTHQTELSTLRDSLRRAKRLLSSTPKSSRHEQEQIIKQLELAVKRAESAVNRDRVEKIEQDALTKAAQEEKDKRKGGKRQWWMKDAQKKELLTRARYDHLAKQGGGRAVKKAIAKKQKKIAQKEKRSRPFKPSGDEPARKRRKL